MKLKVNKPWNVICFFRDSFSEGSPRQNKMDSPDHSEFAHIHTRRIYRSHRHNYHQVLQVQHFSCAHTFNPACSERLSASDIHCILPLSQFPLPWTVSFYILSPYRQTASSFTSFDVFWTSLACSFSSSFLRGLETNISFLMLSLFLAVPSSYLPSGSGDFFQKFCHVIFTACWRHVNVSHFAFSNTIPASWWQYANLACSCSLSTWGFCIPQA